MEKKPDEPEAGLYHKLLFGLSLPERALRSTTAMVGGTLQEAAALLIPQAFRNSRSYTIFVQQSLDFLLQDVGNVARPPAAANSPQAEQDFMARKAVGSFLDIAGLATLHLSPLTMLALMSDIAYGSSTYLKELSDELKRAGVIEQSTTIENACDFLTAIQEASHVSSQVFDTPPLSADGMKETIQQTTDAVRKIDPTKILPQHELQQMWEGIRDVAQREKVSPFEVSSTLALYSIDKIGVLTKGTLSSVTVAGNLFDRHIFDHYRTGLNAIREEGLFPLLAKTYRPYVDAVWQNFSVSQSTVTEDLLTGRLTGKVWGQVRQLWRRESDES